MASGVGAFGGTGQCYRFWLGFTQCRLHASTPALCALEHLDYAECLHRDGLKRRVAAKLLEGARRADELAGGGAGAAHGGGSHGGH